MVTEVLGGYDATPRVLELVHSGEMIERQLIDLASIGGTRIEPTAEQPERYATRRIALSPEDKKAREDFIKPLMLEAGMEVQEHPFGLIGITVGEDPSLAPLVRLSHTDTVPNGDMYDGTFGVIAEIEAARAMKEAGVKPRRTIIDIALTGEESAAFGFATFGSQSMFHGLTAKEFNSTNAQGISIRDSLTPVEIAIVQQPIFGPGTKFGVPHAVIELHVEQGAKLKSEGLDIGIVKAIAAPTRHLVEVGSTSLTPRASDYDLAQYMQLTVKGQAGHSGTTPMGAKHRADGLVETASYLHPFIAHQLGTEKDSLTIGEIRVADGAINKIPGLTTTLLRLNGNTIAEIEEMRESLEIAASDQNRNYDFSYTRFDLQAVSLEEVSKPESAFFSQPEMLRRQAASLALVRAVNQIAERHAAEDVVGTVGTFTTTDVGKIKLGVDIRGIDKLSKDTAVAQIRSMAGRFSTLARVNFGETLSGSGDPVTLDADLVRQAEGAINDFSIGSSEVMFSAAGHDAQNAARAGAASVMLFCQSERKGLAHHPDAYTAPDNLYKGVRALTALSMKLAA
jgi:acetylornithine deacetylase/succinyl-diaminopimelate desuccinylase-like protein